jgi:hypothetical protein
MNSFILSSLFALVFFSTGSQGLMLGPETAGLLLH